MVATSVEVGQPTIGAVFVLPPKIADIMENLIIDNGCITLVNENGNKQIVMTLGFLVGELFETANHHEKHNRPDMANAYRERASRVMETPEYRDWLTAPASTID